MSVKEQILALLEDLPERGLQEALEEVRSIHAYWTGSSLISVELQSSAARLERIKGRLLALIDGGGVGEAIGPTL